MEIVIVDDRASVHRLAADMVAEQLESKPASVLGLATGSTMEGLYAELLTRALDFSAVTTFNLDEYLGLEAAHPCSYHSYMHTHLFNHAEFGCIHLLDGATQEPRDHCLQYEADIARAGGIDLQLLGIGVDGHIAFNEPGSSLASRTRVKTLTPLTRQTNARHFPAEEAVPMHVLTMGIGTIMEARHCLLLALGKRKAQAVRDFVEGAVSARCPASILQMHPRCTVVVDNEAASKLELAPYYRFVWANRPQ